MTEPQRIAWYDNPLIYQRLWSDDADLQTYAEFVAANHAEIFLMRQQRGTKQMTRHYEDFREDEAFDENAEDIVRPEPAFYSHVIERLAANPSMCLRALQCPLQIARSPVLDRSALA
jgi:hypothetical protein